MLFILITAVVWLVFVSLFYKTNRERFSFWVSLLPLLLFSIMVTVDLGINYAGSLDVIRNDGIRLHGVLAPLILGYEGWSIQMFKQAYGISLLTSCILIFLFLISLLFKSEKKRILQ
ncbi:MAG: hypothetical protein FWH08_04675 [Oscillospiraceae bacterium]|nr:hypothetical protein [Oscillospiraceae bacterium]